MRNVAIIGPLRAGKTTVQDWLVKVRGYAPASCADPLKDEVVTALNAIEGGWSRERLDEEKVAYRGLLQWWGTEFRRKQDPLYWVKQVEKRINALNGFPSFTPVAVADGRFINELDLMRDHNFVIIRLVMPNLRDHLHTSVGMSDEQIDAALAHKSEREWMEYPVDYEVASIPGKPEQLLVEVEKLLR
jgi:hypothetical protein